MNPNNQRNEGYTPPRTVSASPEANVPVDPLAVRSIGELDVETGMAATPDTDDDVAVTREQIEETRAHMGETIDAIKEKLSPSTLIAEAKDSLKEAASDTAHHIVDGVVDKAKSAAATATDAVKSAADYVSEKATPIMETAKEKMAPVVDAAKHVGSSAKDVGGSVVETIRMNPLPAALIGLGIGWLLMSARRQHANGFEYDYSPPRRGGYDDINGVSDWDSGRRSAADSTASATGKVRDSLHHAGERVSGLAHGAKDKVTDLAATTKDTAKNTYSSVDTWVHENPLAAGAVALLIGAAVGLTIPASRKENEWFGHTRDELAHQATEKVHDVVDKAKHVAEAAIGTAKNAMSDATQQIKTEVKEELQNQGVAVA